MASTATPTTAPVAISASDARERFERLAQEHFGMSAEEFVKQWRSGAFEGHERFAAAADLAVLLPWAE